MKGNMMIDLFSQNRTSPPLWGFQDVGVKAIMDYINTEDTNKKRDYKSGIAVFPTGTGKSLIIAHLAKRLGRPILILQPSKELLEQNYEKFIDYGGIGSIYSASVGTKQASSCTFATPGSLKGKGGLFRRILNVETVLIDECHKDLPPDAEGMVVQFINELKPKMIIGLTATPIRLAQTPLGPVLNFITRTNPKIFHDVIHVVQIQEIYKEYWKKLNYKLYDFDEKKLKLKSTGQEYTDESIKEALMYNNVNNNICIEIVEQIQKNGVKSVMVFLDSITTCYKMRDWLEKRGIRTAVIEGKMSKKLRGDLLKKYKNQEIQCVLNFGTLTTGFDYKALELLILGRPTNSFSLLYQKIGRLVRRDENIKEGLVIDMCNNIKRLGHIEDITFEFIPDFGWGMFNGEFLMSGRSLTISKLTKNDLRLRAQEKVKVPYTTVHFGKYKDVDMMHIPNSYFKYCLEVMVFDSPIMKKFYNAIFEVMEERENLISQTYDMSEHTKTLVREGTYYKDNLKQ